MFLLLIFLSKQIYILCKSGPLRASLISLWICLFLAITDSGCKNSLGDLKNNIETSNQSVVPGSISVSIEVTRSIRLSDPLQVRWNVSNNSNKQIYLYSSLFDKPHFVETSIDNSDRTIEIRFTRLSTISTDVNYFPAPEFKEVDVGGGLSGTYVSRSKASEEVSYNPNGRQGEANRISGGEWRVRIAAAYGEEITSILKASEDSKASDEHPINPVVKWQKIVYSEFEQINIVK
jgi:hypothetical protein